MASKKDKAAVAKAAGARGGISAEKATRPGHVQALGRGMKAAGVKPNKATFPFDKTGAQKAATHTKPGKPPTKKGPTKMATVVNGKKVTASTSAGRKKMISNKIDSMVKKNSVRKK